MAKSKSFPSLLLAVIWALIVTILLCLPGTEFPRITWLTKIWFDKWMHIFLFLIMVFLWCRVVAGENSDYLINTVFLQITLLCLLYGIIMEFIQLLFIPYRGFEPGDILADAIGVFAGFFISVRTYIKK